MEYKKPLLVRYIRMKDGNVYPVLGDEDTREVTLGLPVPYFVDMTPEAVS